MEARLMLAAAAEPYRVLSVPQWALIGFSIALFAAVLVLFIAPIWVLIEAATIDREAWQAIGRDKTGWILAILFGSFIGAAIYWIKVRPGLRSARRPRA